MGAPRAHHDVVVVGIVQGVGFRPFVARTASALGLSGYVKNVGGNVEISAEGPRRGLDALVRALQASAPAAAVVREVRVCPGEPTGVEGFTVLEGAPQATAASIGADRATCAACFAEHDDPGARRFDYPFVGCTDCGPRLTTVTSAPYERSRTTLASFPPCTACVLEARTPTSRYFAAENVACPACGPRLLFRRAGDSTSIDATARAIECLRRGEIGAVKGVGGYHLVCDATDDAAVRRLRKRKHREEKPLAVVVETLVDAARIVTLDAKERELLGSPGRPIVLARRITSARAAAGTEGAAAIADAVAPGSPLLGVMLPYTPTMRALARAVGRPLVYTSANRSDAPMVIDAAVAEETLASVADFFLHHDRPIAVRADDSVVRVVGGAPLFIRRGRGFAPTIMPLHAHEECGAVLALGAELKSTFSWSEGSYATVSEHLGDLGALESEEVLERAVAHHLGLASMTPTVIAHDLHPDLATTRVAAVIARRTGATCVPVQHHHAHFAAALTDANIDEPALGVVFDGLGYGEDGAFWGGEFLLGSAARSTRFAHLRYVPMPGADRAAREPWRMALAHLLDAGLPTARLERFASKTAIEIVGRATVRGVASPLTSSVGRLFDAIAALVGLRGHVAFEAQAAIELEHAASRSGADSPFSYDVVGADGAYVVDTRRLIRDVTFAVDDGIETNVISARFHATLAHVIAEVAERAREQFAIRTIALSGGVFMNAVLLERSFAVLEELGFHVHRPTTLPPNDASISLGQIAHVFASRRGLT